MGDNRDGSFDSRFWGPMPNRLLKGKAWIVYWPLGRAKGDPMTYKYWLIGCVIFVILEILPPPTHFFFVCMAFGALGGIHRGFVSTSLVWLPWVVFAIVSVALTPLMIPLAKFLFTPKPHASNVDALIGKRRSSPNRSDRRARAW